MPSIQNVLLQLQRQILALRARAPLRTESFSPNLERKDHPLSSAMLVQCFATLVATGFAITLYPSPLAQPLWVAGFQGLCALAIAILLRAPIWWRLIHLAFAPLAVVANGLELPSWLWASGFLTLLLVFWRTDTSQVPLYMTNGKTRDAVLSLLPNRSCRVVDLGCGDGSLLRHLARARPDCVFVGYEHAPVPWIWAWLGARGLRNLSIRCGDFWPHSLAGYDFVYVFLSPAAMPRLWVKACGEMSPNSCLVSNSFVVPEHLPQGEVDVNDRRRTRLNLYLDLKSPNEGGF